MQKKSVCCMLACLNRIRIRIVLYRAMLLVNVLYELHHARLA